VATNQTFKRNYVAKLEFPGGWGRGSNLKTFQGGVWIFSGTTH